MNRILNNITECFQINDGLIFEDINNINIDEDYLRIFLF
ncbi:hypothetical protein M2142_002080 [Fusobacterium sp. PH5-29]